MYTKTLRYNTELENENLVFKIQIPGKGKEDIKLATEDDVLKITVSENENYLIDVSRYWTSAYCNYDTEALKASMKHGLLTVVVPKVKNRSKLVNIE